MYCFLQVVRTHHKYKFVRVYICTVTPVQFLYFPKKSEQQQQQHQQQQQKQKKQNRVQQRESPPYRSTNTADALPVRSFGVCICRQRRHCHASGYSILKRFSPLSSHCFCCDRIFPDFEGCNSVRSTHECPVSSSQRTVFIVIAVVTYLTSHFARHCRTSIYFYFSGSSLPHTFGVDLVALRPSTFIRLRLSPIGTSRAIKMKKIVSVTSPLSFSLFLFIYFYFTLFHSESGLSSIPLPSFFVGSLRCLGRAVFWGSSSHFVLLFPWILATVRCTFILVVGPADCCTEADRRPSI